LFTGRLINTIPILGGPLSQVYITLAGNKSSPNLESPLPKEGAMVPYQPSSSSPRNLFTWRSSQPYPPQFNLHEKLTSKDGEK